MLRENFLRLLDIFGILGTYLSRPEVALQVGLFYLVVIITGMITLALWYRLVRPFSTALQNSASPLWQRILINMGSTSIFPVVGLLLIKLTEIALRMQGRLSGLLTQLSWVFVTILVAGVLMALLYTNMDSAERRHAHFRFLVPFLFVISVLQINWQLIDLGEVAEVVVVILFQSPISVGALFIATIGLWLYVELINTLHTFAVNTYIRYTQRDDGEGQALLLLLRYALILAGIAFALGRLNLNSTTIAAISGGLSVGIGFGLRDVLGNFIAGILLLFERTLHNGDVIEVDGEIARVQSVSIRSTRVRTINHVDLVIPNQTFLTSQFKRYTGESRQVRFPITIHANYENDMSHVIDLLTTAAQAHPDVLTEPAVDVQVQDAFGDNVISYDLYMWADQPMEIPRIKSDVTKTIWASFSAENINLTFPDVELHFNDSLAQKWPNARRSHGKITARPLGGQS